MSHIDAEPGTYLLLLRLPRSLELQIGRLGRFQFPVGWYLYVGSAFGPGGVKARCAHHAKIAARPRWHIDYLRAHCELRDIWFTHAHQHLEHQWAAELCRSEAIQVAVDRFGASDCGCVSHLFYSRRRPEWRLFRQRLAMQLFRVDRFKCEVG